MKNLICVFLLGCFLNSYSQTTFLKSYVYADHLISSSPNTTFIQQTSDSGYFITSAYRAIPSSATRKAWAMKTNSFGVVEWSKLYGSGDEFSNTGMQTNDGGYILVGNSYAGAVNYPFLIIKTDANGDTSWTKLFHENIGSGYPRAYCIKQTADNGYLIGGNVNGVYNLSSVADACLIKIDSIGNIQWSKLYHSSSETIHSFEQTIDGGYILVGRDVGNPYEGFVIKTDGLGNIIWNRLFSDSNNHLSFFSVCNAADGGYVAVGNNYSSGLVVKFNSIGDTLWVKKYSNIGLLHGIKPTNDSNFVVSGYNGFMKINNSGDTIWTRFYDHNIYPFCHGLSMNQSFDGSLILAGIMINSNPSLAAKFFLGNSDSLGLLACRLNQQIMTIAGINVTITNPAYLTDTLILVPGSANISVNNLINESTVCLSASASELPDIRIDLFPNPSQGNFTLTTSESKVKKIEFFNSIGEIIDFKINNSQNLISISLLNCRSGIYFSRITLENDYVLFSKIFIVD